MNEASVVVGVDGCDSCQAALRYAIEATGRRGCRLTIVVAYRRPGVSVIESAGPADEDLAADAQATAQRCLDLAGETIVPDDLECRVMTEERPPVDALAAGAQNAIVIVVGGTTGKLEGKTPPARRPLGYLVTARFRSSAFPPATAGSRHRARYCACSERAR